MTDWNRAEMAMPAISVVGWMRVVGRGLLLAAVVYGCLAVFLVLRVIEAAAYGLHRPWTPRITVFVCRAARWPKDPARPGSGFPSGCSWG